MLRQVLTLTCVLVSTELLIRSRMTRELRIDIAAPTRGPRFTRTIVFELRKLHPMHIECL